MDTKYLSVESYDADKISIQRSNYVWNIITKWKYFEKDIYQLIHYTNTKLKYLRLQVQTNTETMEH